MQSDGWMTSCLLISSQCVEGVIGGTDYNQSKVNQWTASIVEHSLTHLVKQGRAFKYIGEQVPVFDNVSFQDIKLICSVCV